MPADTYEISSGVRRAKTYQLAGRTSILAEVFARGGKSLGVRQLDIDQLLSPKPVIDLTLLVSHKIQFIQMEWDAANGAVFPPIEVFSGNMGTPIRNVTIIR